MRTSAETTVKLVLDWEKKDEFPGRYAWANVSTANVSTFYNYWENSDGYGGIGGRYGYGYAVWRAPRRRGLVQNPAKWYVNEYRGGEWALEGGPVYSFVATDAREALQAVTTYELYRRVRGSDMTAVRKALGWRKVPDKT